MKKFLLSFALFAAAVIPVKAQDYVLYVGTETENGSVLNYKPVTDGENIVINPHFSGEDLECVAYVKIANNTSADATASISLTKLEDKNVFNGTFVMFQACVGGACQETNVTAEVAANEETEGGRGEHIGYSAMFITQEQANALVFDSKYKVNFKMGNVNQTFTLTYSSTINSVGSVAAETTPAEYYNLQGMRVANPVEGEMYIVRQGGKVSKSFMR